jgi:membrane-associated protease RseP (regulator of RpoE activity)
VRSALSSLLDPYIPLLEYLAVWVAIFAIGVLLKAERYGIIVKPYYLMLKTSIFNKWLEKLASRFRRAWLTYFDIGAAMGFGLLVFAIVAYILSAITLYNRPPQGGVRGGILVPLPGVTIGWDIFPYILISIAALLIPHEAAHGIASALDKVPIKASGAFVAIFLGGAFVEIDEEDLSKRRARTKLRVFAGGTFTNIVSWFLVILLFANFTLTITPLYQSNSSGVLITSLVTGGAAQSGNIPNWSVLTGVNGTIVKSTDALRSVLSPLAPGHHLVLSMNNGKNYTLVTQPAPDNSSRATIGIFVFNYYQPRASFLPVSLPFHFFNTLQWMSLILLVAPLSNMLPLFPFDGDKYFDTILTSFGLKNTKNVRIVAGIASLTLLAANLVLIYAVSGSVFLR